MNIKVWEKPIGTRQVINNDVTNYYCYLPAAFIHKDLTFRFTENDFDCYKKEAKFWPIKVEGSDKYVIKMSMGLSYLYAPFFGIAHLYASNSKEYNADGFTTPYEVLLVISSIFWVFIGFVYLRLVLLKYFSELISGLVMISVLIGTNLYFYSTTEPAMSHAYSFGLVAMFLYYCIQWLTVSKIKYALALGMIGGVVTLIRPTNILIFLFLVFYGIKSLEELKLRFVLFWKLKYQVLLIGLVFLIPIFPQLLFWKINAGSWVYYSYTDEQFYFNNSHVYYGLFSYRKGWFLYTPIMLFAVAGLFTSFRNKEPYVWTILIFLPVFVYVIFSWWCWWYGGGFGARPMIDVYGLMALPLASFFKWVGELNWKYRVLPIVVVLFFIFLNLFQTAQKRKGYIHYSAMTKEAYWSNFLSLEDAGGFWEKICDPDDGLAIKGEEEYKTMSSALKHWMKQEVVGKLI